ncbi:hypothetical protein [Neptunomonas japonica]|uniref:hypothetical protein n=1 Tax=Neptunomonas japonica TaxID=417574 RepID=UPI00040318E1|nr:hypothetical protein [Neptunomonas japonica]
MKISSLSVALILSSSSVFAGNADSGLELYQEVEIERTISGEQYTDANCETCHGTEIYQREDRKATTYAKLESRVEGCNTNLDVGWFPEDVSDVAAYLNREYYKFAK